MVSVLYQLFTSQVYALETVYSENIKKFTTSPNVTNLNFIRLKSIKIICLARRHAIFRRTIMSVQNYLLFSYYCCFINYRLHLRSFSFEPTPVAFIMFPRYCSKICTDSKIFHTEIKMLKTVSNLKW